MNIHKKDFYQKIYLKKAINEYLEKHNLSHKKKLVSSIKISIDHYNGINYINSKKYPLIFHKHLINYIKNLEKNKSIDYNFIGNITKSRNWINKYKNC
jgi:hypothetical protein